MRQPNKFGFVLKTVRSRCFGKLWVTSVTANAGTFSTTIFLYPNSVAKRAQVQKLRSSAETWTSDPE